MYYVVFTTDKDNSLELRESLRPEHRIYLREHKHPIKVMVAGPTLDDFDGKMNGTLLVIEAENLEKVMAYIAEDPYVKNDLFKNIIIRPWEWGLGFPGESL